MDQAITQAPSPPPQSAPDISEDELTPAVGAQADRNLYQPLIKHIPPFVMRQLVQSDIPKLLFGNIRPWQYDARAKRANQQRG